MIKTEFTKYDKCGAYHWQEKSSNIFNNNAYLRGRYKVVTDIIRHLHLPRTSHIVDIGTGDGALLGSIAQSGYEVTGLDNNEQGIKLAKQMFHKKRLNGDFHIIKDYDYPFEDNTFDCVVCTDVIEHVQEPQKLLQQAMRIIKPGGYFILTTPIRTLEHYIDDLHKHEFFTQELQSFCKQHITREPVIGKSTHPLFWYELYTHKNNLLIIALKLLIKSFDLMGFNPFLQDEKSSWKHFTMQTLVFRK